ncbi:hypothetical protein COV18_05105 [Candidatus Woesearchaeota archaeon CG10_big_fil_rev_8_21_14_0_10_37_12]|nr:MAG: hypothetical protein COV18_05105 [Candidatus Woesearchaeota archaeon CG10_big_fil_rev_8_21_14_0_10_37_12]
MKVMTTLMTTVLVLILISCTTNNETIKIGGVFHLTGPAAVWGEGEMNAAALAVEEINNAGGINGKQTELIIEDSKTDFTTTTTAFRKLIELDEIKMIVGPTWFGQVAYQIADETGTIIISPSTGTSTPSTIYFFNLWPHERAQIIPEIEYMKTEGIKKIAIVHTTNEWSESMKQNFVDEARKQNLTIVKEFGSAPDEQDFKTIITQLKQLDIDVVYAPFAFYPSQGAFSKQAKELGLTIPIYSTDGTENVELLTAFPEIEGTIYPYRTKGPREDEFISNYRAKFNKDPSPASAYAYDAVMLLVGTLKEGKQSPDEIADYLRSIKNHIGASNRITFDEFGRVAEKPYEMKIVENNSFIIIS